MVEFSLDIPEKIYDQLSRISEAYSQDVEKTVNEILDAVSYDTRLLVETKRVDIISNTVQDIISSNFDSGNIANNKLFDPILKELNGEGHFGIVDMEINLDDNRMWFSYAGFQGSPLFVDSIEVTFSGLKTLFADCLFEVDGYDDYETVKQVEEHARRIKRIKKELPEEFRDLDPWEISILEQDETMSSLRVRFSEETIDYLPSIPAVSEFFEKVLKSAGIKGYYRSRES